jgi:uncharacterized protein YacL
MDDIVKVAIGLVLALALVPVIANMMGNAQNASGVTDTQSVVIGLILTVFVLAVAWKAYDEMV